MVDLHGLEIGPGACKRAFLSKGRHVGVDMASVEPGFESLVAARLQVNVAAAVSLSTVAAFAETMTPKTAPLVLCLSFF